MKNERWDAIEALFHASRELEGKDRALFLDRECGTDGAMRRKVEALLRGDEEAKGILNRTGRPIAIMDTTKIGPYEIVGWLGAGGMGEVYRARDPRLGRDVAIKLIRENFAADAMRVHRFEQEARAAGQLNHPNILAVYDVGLHADTPYIVSELLEGESLRSILNGGTIPVRKAIDYARQTAEGLAAAHDKGIVHRDLKPDNLFVTSEGRLKVLDFGLAKLTQPADDALRPMWLPIETEAGKVMGTVAYMSPEQVRGEVVDHRSDIFSFGVVLHELMTGRPAFSRETAAETMTAILKEDPPELPTSGGITPALACIVSRCLEKTRERRFQSARDLAFGLEVFSGTATALPAQMGATSRRVWLRQLPWAVAGVLLLERTLWQPKPSVTLQVNRSSWQLPTGQRLDGSGGAHVVALSPNGTQIAYVALPSLLYLRPMEKLEAAAIPGAEAYEGVREPVFSPDGLSIAFYAFSDKTLRKIAVTGGAASLLCKSDTPSGMSWGPDGIVYGQRSEGIWHVSSEGGTPEQLVTVNDGEEAHGPQMLPGGQHLLFTLAAGPLLDRWDKARIVVQSLKSGKRTTLKIEEGTDARFVPTGHIVYARGGSLYAKAFNEDVLDVRGNEKVIVEGVMRAAGSFTGAAMFSFAGNGSLIYVPGPLMSTSPAPVAIALLDRKGKVEELPGIPPGQYLAPRASPDGKSIAFGKDEKQGIVRIYELNGKNAVRPLASQGSNRFPIWTADSQRIVFQSGRDDGSHGIWWQRADGIGTADRLTTPDPGTSHVPQSWHPTKNLFLYDVKKGSEISLWTFSVEDMAAAPFDNVTSSTPTGAVFSHDGRWVAHSSTAGKTTTLFVRPFPATGEKHTLLSSKASDSPKHPRWSPNDKELVYNPRPDGFERVSIATQPFAFGNPEGVLRKFKGGSPEEQTPYDITPSGDLVCMVSPGQSEYIRGSNDQIRGVLNWFEELKAQVP